MSKTNQTFDSLKARAKKTNNLAELLELLPIAEKLNCTVSARYEELYKQHQAEEREQEARRLTDQIRSYITDIRKIGYDFADLAKAEEAVNTLLNFHLTETTENA